MKIHLKKIHLPRLKPLLKKGSFNMPKMRQLECDVFNRSKNSYQYYDYSNYYVARDYFAENMERSLEEDINLFEQCYSDLFHSVPLNFAMMIQNSLAKKGNAIIIDEVPEIFKDFDMNEVLSELNFFAQFQKNKIIISGKPLNIEYINEGNYGRVFKISDKKGNKVAMKIYDPDNEGIDFSYYGMLNEIPTLRQLSKDKVKDVPKFYMAKANCYELTANSRRTRPWVIEEFIDPDTPLKKEGITLHQWLEKNKAYHCDESQKNFVGNYIVDVGGIKTKLPSPEENFLFAITTFVPEFRNYKIFSYF